MAQHYRVGINKEVEVKRSIIRIGKYIHRYLLQFNKYNFFKDYKQTRIYGKNVQFLPNDYKTKERDEFVISIKSYSLKRTKEEWGEYWNEAVLECHFDKQGNIVNVYYPL